MPAGQPTKLTLKMKKRIKMLARKGLTDEEMALAVDVTERTINNWKKQQPEFFQALKDWKKQADEEVERSLYERACGYNHDERKLFKTSDDQIISETVTKHYAPDPTSMIFWLKNRQPAKWRDKLDHGGDLSITINRKEYTPSK